MIEEQEEKEGKRLQKIIVRWMLKFGSAWVSIKARKEAPWYWNKVSVVAHWLPTIMEKETPNVEYDHTRIRLSEGAHEFLRKHHEQ